MIFCTLPIRAQQTPATGEITLALLPILDSFPFYVAKEAGYFKESGIKVKVIPVSSALERDQLMQSGAIDGMLNELISTANFNRSRIEVKAVITARKAYPQYPLFRILASPGEDLRAPSDIGRRAVGVSKNTIIEYVTDRLLAAEGLDPATIVKTSVPAIPERYQLLIQGQLQIATLPDPLAKSALTAGAERIIDDSAHPEYSTSVLSFNAGALERKSESVRLFLKAWDRAAADINQEPDAFRALLLRKIRVPPNIRQTYRIPPYPRREVPVESQWNDVMQWMVQKGLLDRPLAYKNSVTLAYLPK